jgi:hypothetical protein
VRQRLIQQKVQVLGVARWTQRTSNCLVLQIVDKAPNYGSREGTSDFGFQTSNIGSFRASLIANIAFAKLANISGTY